MTGGHLEQVRAGVDFVEARLDTDFALRDVSRAAAMSHWHFQRIFRALTGETLMTYVRARRMANALDRLLRSGDRILDVAIGAGFDSQEAFTRAFKQQFAMTPGEYRRLGDKSLFLQKAAIDEAYLRHIGTGTSLEPRIEVRPRMLLIGMRTEFFGRESERNDIGDKLPPLWDAFMSRAGEVADAVEPWYYGVVQPARHDDDLLVYHAAVEVLGGAAPPDEMTGLALPEGLYAHFTHRGPAADVDHTVNYAYSTWLLQSDRRHTFGPDIEIYGPGYHPTSPDSVFDYALPID